MLIALPIEFVVLELSAVGYCRFGGVCIHVKSYSIQMIMIFELFRGP